MTNRVQPAEDISTGQPTKDVVSHGALSPEQSAALLLATDSSGSGTKEEVTSQPLETAQHTTDAKRGSLEIYRAPTAQIHAWQLMQKAKFIAQRVKREEMIDIYHDAKLESTSKLMIHPNSLFRRGWDICTTLLVMYVCTTVPLMIGFGFLDWSTTLPIDVLIDFYFLMDMFVTLRTGIFQNGEVVMDARTVARKYLSSWFFVDVLSNFPMAIFIQESARKSIKIVKLQKIPKLLRFGRLLKYLREYAKYYNVTLSILALFMGLHFFACLWSSLFNRCDEFECLLEDMGKMYIQCIHIVLLMILGIAEYTTYAPLVRKKDSKTVIQLLHTPLENEAVSVEVYILSISIFFFGLIFSSLLFGNVLALLMSWDQQIAMFRNRMDVITAEMKYYELPEDLQHRVRRNYDYLWINQRAYSDMMLLNQPGISKPLRMTIALHLYKDLLQTVPFFAGCDQKFLGKVCLALETAVYLPGDTIIYVDDVGKEMFIVRKGLVEILIPEPNNPNKKVYLRDGNFFGETALVIDVRRTNTVKAVNICDLNVLSKTAFNEIVAEYPEFGERMKRTVIKRQLDNMNIQSPTEKAKIHNQLNMVVEKSLKARRMSVSLRAIYRAKKLGDKLKEIADRAAKNNTRHKISRRLSHMVGSSGNSLRDKEPSPVVAHSKPSSQTTTTTHAYGNDSHGHPVTSNLVHGSQGTSHPHGDDGNLHSLGHTTGNASGTPLISLVSPVDPRVTSPPSSNTGAVGALPGTIPEPRETTSIVSISSNTTHPVAPVTTGASALPSHPVLHHANTYSHGSPIPTISAGVPLHGSNITPVVERGVGGVAAGTQRLNKTPRSIPQIDVVYRKLSRAEMTMDLIPNVLLEITEMVNEIKKTTERLNRHLTTDDSSVEEDSGDEDEEDRRGMSESEIGTIVDEEQEQVPRSPDLEEEVARRDSNSTITGAIPKRQVRSSKLEALTGAPKPNY